MKRVSKVFASGTSVVGFIPFHSCALWRFIVFLALIKTQLESDSLLFLSYYYHRCDFMKVGENRDPRPNFSLQ